ncbi:MAG: hypothetical protein NW226_02605 [Microscillaceae bacterium]|nr:hypothetical protein [Microscillaceae bacterium]
MEKITRFVKNTLVLLFLILLLMAYYDIRDIGEQVTVYRDTTGKGLGTINPDWFFYAPLIFLILLNVIISRIARMVGDFPLQKLNLPQKDFWFEDAEREEKLEVVLKTWVYGFALIFNILFVVLISQIWMAHRGLGGQLYQYGLILVVFTVVLLGWIGFIFYRLRLRKEEFIS